MSTEGESVSVQAPSVLRRWRRYLWGLMILPAVAALILIATVRIGESALHRLVATTSGIIDTHFTTSQQIYNLIELMHGINSDMFRLVARVAAAQENNVDIDGEMEIINFRLSLLEKELDSCLNRLPLPESEGGPAGLMAQIETYRAAVRWVAQVLDSDPMAAMLFFEPAAAVADTLEAALHRYREQLQLDAEAQAAAARQDGEQTATLLALVATALIAGSGVVAWAVGRRVRRHAFTTDQLERAVAARTAELSGLAERLEVARDRAEEANRTKSEFLANMSHELRTPLNAIIGFSEVMAQEFLGPIGSKTYRDYAGSIHGAGLHLLDMISDLLDLAKIEAGRMTCCPEWVERNAALEPALALIRPLAAERKIRLHWRIGPGVTTIWADPRALKQILLNLLSNAVKFTEPGGIVALTVGRGEGGEICLEVADTGIGMSPSDLAIALEKFGQVESAFARQHRGTGLGLPLVRGLVELHGGRLQIRSQPGEGTTVSVILPSGPANSPGTC